MKAELTDLSETRKSLAVEIPTTRVDTEIERLSQRYRRTVKIKGFRPGKAPERLVRHRLRDQILQEVAEDLVPKAVDQLLAERALEPVDTPSIRDVRIEEGEPLTFTATFETVPSVDPGEYRGLSLRRPPVAVGEDKVEAALEEVRQRAARLVSVEGRSVAQGDTVTLNLDRRALKAPLAQAEGGVEPPEHHDGVDVEVGNPANPPGFDEQLVGLDVDDTRQFTLTYPPDHEVAAVAGAEVAYTVTVTGIRERVLPALDDDLAKELGHFETLDALTATVRDDLTRRAERAADSQVRSDLLRQLAGRVTGEVPEALVTREVDRRVQHFIGHLVSQQVDPRRADLDWEAFRQEQREPAIATVRSTLVLDEIAQREELTVEPADVDAEIQRQAERAGRTVSATKALLDNEGGLAQLRIGLRREKAIELVLSEATIITV